MLDYDNAYWNGSVMTYGDGSVHFDVPTSIDVAAHEIGHAGSCVHPCSSHLLVCEPHIWISVFQFVPPCICQFPSDRVTIESKRQGSAFHVPPPTK
jgi:hypothetical protein